MNKKIIGLSIAMLFAANGAYAQSTNGSSVELYGVLDLSVGNVQYSLATDPNFPATVNPASPTKVAVSQSATGVFNGALTPSRWGIRGTEDLGGGLKAIFNVDSYFNPNSGTLSSGATSLANNRSSTTGTVSAASSVSGQLFNDIAFVGLSDETMGTLTLGRQWEPMGDILRDYDAVQDAQLFSPLGFSGKFAGGGLTENKRQDNSIKYANKFSDFNVTAMAKFGGISGKSSAASSYALAAGYEADGFGVKAAFESDTDALAGGNSFVPNEINVTNYNTTAFMIAAKYVMGDAKVTGGYEMYTLKKPSDALAAMGVTTYYGYQICNVLSTTFCKSATAGSAPDFASADQKTNIIWVGADYNFTPAFNLAAGFYDIAPKKSDDAKQLDGNIYAYSLLADYHFSKRTDAYAGVMYSQYKGDQYPSATYNTSNYIVAVGLRTKF